MSPEFVRKARPSLPRCSTKIGSPSSSASPFSFWRSAALVHIDLIGWVVSTSVWSNFGQALGPASKGYAALGGIGALLATYVALTLVLSAGAAALKN